MTSHPPTSPSSSPSWAGLSSQERAHLNNYQKVFFSIISDPEFPRISGVTMVYLQKLGYHLKESGITHKVGRSGIWWSRRGHLLGHLAFGATLCDKCGYGLGNPVTCASCHRGDAR